MESPTLKRTPLYQKHLDLGAKMVPFAGWEMPVSYPSGIIAEHNAVRNSVGIFDIGHMGLMKIEGEQALDLIQRVSTNDASLLSVNEIQYSILCHENGGIIDDVLVYRLPMLYLIVCNAVNTEKVFAWLKAQSQAFPAAAVSFYENYGMLSVQGPKAQELASKVLGAPLSELKHNHCLWWKDIVISRTGYTGEDGFELIVAKKEVAPIWSQFIAEKIQPCGLGARDTLRLEAGLPLYGHEYDDETTPLEAGYGWAVKLRKTDFIGKAALQKQKETGLVKKLVGLEVDGQLIPREGCPVYGSQNSVIIGKVTSGAFSPTLKKPIALAYLSADEALLGSGVLIEIRQRRLPAKIVAKSFYKR